MKKTTLRDILFGLLGAGSLLVGVVVADLVADDGEITVPRGDVSFPLPLEEPTEVGALLAPVAVPVALEPFADVAVPVPVEPDDTGEAAAGGSDGATSSSAGAGVGPGAAPPESGSPETVQPGQAAAGAAATIIRFLDLCAENPASVGCPGGVGATVLFKAPGSPLPPLEIKILPEATRALYPGLRCTPEWPTHTVIPIVLVSNRPLTRGGGLTLYAADGTTELDSAPKGTAVLQSEPSEHQLFDSRRAANKPFGATIADGYHTCLAVSVDAKVQQPPHRNSTFEVRVAGFHDDGDAATPDGATARLRFTGQHYALRPSIRLVPENANRAILIVPQRSDEQAVLVWVQRDAVVWETRPCEVGTGQALFRVNPTAAPSLYPPPEPDSPWDQSYDRYTVWELNLPHAASQYTLCVRWTTESVTEQWDLETPNGSTVRISTTDNITQRSVNPTADYRVRVAGCGTVSASHGTLCEIPATRLGSTIEFFSLIKETGSTWPNQVYGRFSVPTAAVLTRCEWAGSGPPDWSPCTGYQLEWYNLNTLCGGSTLFPPTSCADVIAAVGIEISVYTSTQTNRPDPTDWGFSRIFPPP